MIGLWLAGVPAEHINTEPACRMSRVALGYALVLAPALGAGGAFVTLRALGMTVTAAAIGAVFAALFFLILDRAIFISLGKKGGWFAVCIRLLAAGLVNTIVSHVLVLSLFSGAIELEQRAVESAEIAHETSISTDRVAKILDALKTQQKSLMDELAAIPNSVTPLLAQREALEKELSGWRVKLDDEIQGRRASGIPTYGPEAKRLEDTFIKPLVSKQEALAQQLKDYDRHADILTGQIHDLADRINRNPQLLAETAALQQKITEIHAAQRGDILSRTRALHTIMGREKSLFGLYLLILGALFLLDTAAIVLKATATRDAVDFRREMETHGAFTDLEVFKRDYASVVAEKEAVRAKLEIFRAEVNAAKSISIEKTKAFVSLIEELFSETKTGIVNSNALVRQFSTQPNADIPAKEFNANLMRLLIRTLDASLHDFSEHAARNEGSEATSVSPNGTHQHANGVTNNGVNGHSGNGSSFFPAHHDRF